VPALRLQGSAFFAAWLGVGAAELAVGWLAGPTGAILGLGMGAVAEGFVLEHAFGTPMIGPWALATFVATVLGSAFGTLSAQGIPTFPGGPTGLYSIFVASVVFGTTIGVAQWAVLRRARSLAWIWIPTAVFGVGLPSLVASIARSVPSAAAGLVVLAVSGSVLLVLQAAPAIPEGIPED
jgi:hypothetical protein